MFSSAVDNVKVCYDQLLGLSGFGGQWVHKLFNSRKRKLNIWKVLENCCSCKIITRCVLLFVKPVAGIIIERKIMTRRELNVYCK